MKMKLALCVSLVMCCVAFSQAKRVPRHRRGIHNIAAVLSEWEPLYRVWQNAGTKLADAIRGLAGDHVSTNEETVHHIPIHQNLAAEYGNLTCGGYKLMDDEMKMMIAGTLLTMKNKNITSKSWLEIRACFETNPLLRLKAGSEIDHMDHLFKENQDWTIQTDNSADQDIVYAVKRWFREVLITDADVRLDTKIEMGAYAQVVAWTGAVVNSFETLFYAREKHSRTVIDVGVIRFPNPDEPYFKLYRIKLSAFSDSTRILAHQVDKNGIEGEFNAASYEISPSFLALLRPKVKRKLVAMFEDMVDVGVFNNGEC